MSREEATEIVLNFEKSNTHGTGYAYSENGKLVIHKFPIPVSKVVKKLGKKFLQHMPCDSYTIVHLRLASHGAIAHENCHPFNLNDNWAFIHNGVYSEYKLPRLILEKYVKLEGNTDTIVAGHLYSTIGPKKFTETVDTSGVFMALHKNGNLNVIMTSGDLVFQKRENGTYLLASELKSSYDCLEGIKGWYKFNKDGTFNKFTKKMWGYQNNGYYSGGKWNKTEEPSTVTDSPPGEKPRSYFYDNKHDYSGHNTSRLPSIYREGITGILTQAEREELEREIDAEYTIPNCCAKSTDHKEKNKEEDKSFETVQAWGY